MSLKKYLTGFTAVLATLAFSASAAIAQSSRQADRVLIVVSSLDKKAENLVGGYWFPELTHPVEVFDKAGLEFDIASPKGGLAPFDGFDLKDQATLNFWTNPNHRAKIASSIKLTDVDPSKYSAILLVGGHGPMWDFVDNPDLINIIQVMHKKNDIISAVCHGPAGLINVKLPNGKRLIEGRRLTAFTAEEEVSRQYDKLVPFELEGSLKASGAKFEEAPIFQNKVVIDGQLITGQNPASATALGEAVVNALKAKRI